MNIVNTINNNYDNIWTICEDNKLEEELNKNISINEIMKNHKRKKDEIENRIIKIIINKIENNNKHKEIYNNYINYLDKFENKSCNTKWTENEDKNIIDEIKRKENIEEIIKNHNKKTKYDIKIKILKLLSIYDSKCINEYEKIATILNIDINVLYNKIEDYKNNKKDIKIFTKI